MEDINMLPELAIITSCLFIAIITWAWIDTKQENRLLNDIHNEHSPTKLNDRRHSV